MKDSYYFYSDGQIKRKDNTLQFVNTSGEKRDIPIERISEIYVMSEMTVNTSMINYLSQYGICMHFFNYYSFYSGSFYPRESLLAGNLIIKQSEHYINLDKRLLIAQKILDAAAENIYRNLRYYNGRGKDLVLFMEDIDRLKKKIPLSKSIQELMGYEGNIRKLYYKSWNTVIDADIDFDKRVKHPPDNMINTLISFVNTLIYTKILGELYRTQLNPTISYLHEPGVRRFSLCLDIAEIFKPLIGDRLIFTLLNRRQITEKSFVRGLNNLHLTKEASQTIVSALDERLKKTIKHKTLGKNVSYQYLIRLEGYKLIKHLLDEKEYDGFRIWW